MQLTNIPTPERDVDQDFLMPVEDVFSISGRGTVVTGRIEKGTIKIGENNWNRWILWYKTTTATGVEMFRKKWIKVKLVITVVFF